MKKTLYKQTYTFNEERKNLGFDYNDKILKKSISRYLLTFEHISGFVNKLEPAITLMYNSIKILKNYTNFTVDKDDNNGN